MEGGEDLAEVDPIEVEAGAILVALSMLVIPKQILQFQKKEHQVILKGSQRGKTRRTTALGTSLTLPTPMKVMLQMHPYPHTNHAQIRYLILEHPNMSRVTQRNLNHTFSIHLHTMKQFKPRMAPLKPIKGLGNVQCTPVIKLSSVLHVPVFPVNLVSECFD